MTHLTNGPVAGIERDLERVRSGARRLLLVRAAAILVAWFAGAGLAIGLLDYLVRMPAGLRLALWLVGLTLIIEGARRFIWPALRFRPALTEVALRLERTGAGRGAGLQGVLTSGLELSGQSEHESSALRASVVAEAVRRIKAVRARRAVLSTGRTHSSLALAAVVLAPLAALALVWPTLTRIGAERVLLPWTGAAWPKRTEVFDATTLVAHPLGTAVPLKAVLSRTDRPPGRTDVWANYHLITDGKAGPVRRALLTGQGRKGSSGTGVEGELYERLIEPTGLALGAEEAAAASAGESDRRSLAMEFWFETDDDRTSPRRIRLVEAPAVVAASATITSPEYARQGAGTELATGSRDLGNGRDERASVGPILAGSEITLVLDLNKPLSPPSSLTEAFPGATLPEDLGTTATGSSWRLTWVARESVRLPVSLKDQYGIAGDRESLFQFNVVADRPPTAAVIEPAQDEAVLATAVVAIIGEGRDDVGLAWAQLDSQLARAPAGSTGAPAEAQGPIASLARLDLAPGAEGQQRQARVSAELRLSGLGLKPRDEVWLTAVAQDIFAMGGSAHEPSRSAVRRLRIISEAEMVTQLHNELAAVRQAALRLDQDQAQIAHKTAEGGDAAAQRPAQDGITQRLTPQADIVRRLAERLERNALQDRALSGMLEDAAGLLDDAARASAEAGAGLENLERPQDDQARAAQAGAVAKSQEQVRDHLGRLIAMLDRGQDGWTARREVQRLLEEQRQLQRMTSDLGRQTTGKSAAELSSAQRDQLEEIARQQADLSRRAQSAIEDLSQRARQLEKNDPALSRAMDQAAQRGRESQVSDVQRQASQQVQQNQTSAATQSQEQAAQALEEMLDELDSSEENRDEALRRTLEDVIQSIDALIGQQQTELDALAKVLGQGPFTGLDAGMIKLHGATLALIERVRSTFRELASVADLLESAGKAQETAVVLLRAQDPEGTEAQQAETISLDRLREARAEADRLRQQAEDRDQARKRGELRKAYREALETQVALHGRTGEFIGKQLDRRERATVRALGEQQQVINKNLADLRKKTAEMEEARLFDFAHQRLDGATGRAAGSLREGAATIAVDRDQRTSVRILQALVEALKEGKPGDFRDQADSGGSGEGQGSGGGPLIPPLAELRLLRMMQQEAADLTRSVADTEPALLDEVGQLQDELARRGMELLQRNAPTPDAGNPEPAPSPQPRFGAWFGVEPPEEPAEPPAETKEPKKEQPPSRPPTLDELLGLPGADRKEQPDDQQDPLDAALERKLAPEEAGEQFQQAVHMMHETADRLRKARDPGVRTQRLQDEIIRRLDQIIASAEQRQSRSSSSSSSSRSQQQQQRQQQAQPSQSATPGGDNQGQVNPPARRDGQGRTLEPGAGAAWGNLPEHIRDALIQGRSDRFSALYQALTEAYYRRLAEPGAPARPEAPR